jgi:hypothetical protein
VSKWKLLYNTWMSSRGLNAVQKSNLAATYFDMLLFNCKVPGTHPLAEFRSAESFNPALFALLRFVSISTWPQFQILISAGRGAKTARARRIRSIAHRSDYNGESRDRGGSAVTASRGNGRKRFESAFAS